MVRGVTSEIHGAVSTCLGTSRRWRCTHRVIDAKKEMEKGESRVGDIS